MVKGYDNERQAIINKNTALDDTIAKLKEEIKLENDKLLIGGQSLFDTASKETDDYEKQLEFIQQAKTLMETGEFPLLTNALKLKDVFDGIGLDGWKVSLSAVNAADNAFQIDKAKNDAEKQKRQLAYNTLLLKEKDILEQISNVKVEPNKAIQAFLENTFSDSNLIYSSFDSQMQNIISQIANGLDPANFDFNINEMEAWINQNILRPFYNNKDEISNAINNLFVPNIEELPVDVYAKLIQDFLDTVSKSLPMEQVLQLKVILGLDVAEENIQKIKQEAIDKFTQFTEAEIGSLNATQLTVATNVDFKFDGNSFEDFRNQIEDFAELSKVANSIKQVYDNIVNLQSKYASGTTDVDKYTESLHKQLAEIEAIIDANPQMAKDFQSAINTIKTSLDNLPDSSNALSKSINLLNNAQTEAERTFIKSQIETILKNLHKEAEDGIITWVEYESKVKFAENAMKSFSDIVSDAVEIHNKQIDSAQSEIGDLNKTIKSLNENQSMSADEMLDLIQKYPQLKSKIKETSNGYTIETDVLETLRQAKIDEFETAIKSEIEKTRQTLSSIQSRLSMYKIEIGAIKDLATAQAEVAKLGGEKYLDGGLDALSFDDSTNSIITNDIVARYDKEQYDRKKAIFEEQIDAKKSLIELGNLYESLDTSLALLNNISLGTSSGSTPKPSKETC